MSIFVRLISMKLWIAVLLNLAGQRLGRHPCTFCCENNVVKIIKFVCTNNNKYNTIQYNFSIDLLKNGAKCVY